MTRAPEKRISSARTVGVFLNGRACSDTLFHVLNGAFDQQLKPEERACSPLAGGIMQHGYQCGMLWGAALAAGAQAYRLFGSGPRAEAKAMAAATRLVEAFRGLNHTTDCYDITHLNNSSTTMQMVTYFLLKGGSVGCFRMAARYAPLAFEAASSALGEERGDAPSAPVSCAAMLARKLGASDMHAVMAAGLAGGIGLSGGACGALGAAIWLTSMGCLEEGGKLEYKSPRAAAVIERFLSASDYEFECATIVGRRFESTADHATHVRDGGCSRVLEALTSRPSAPSAS